MNEKLRWEWKLAPEETLQPTGCRVNSSEVKGNNIQRLWDWVLTISSLKPLTPSCWFMTARHRGVWRVCEVCTRVSGWMGQDTGEMNALGVHTSVQRTASCVSVVIRAFFSVCVKVKTEPDYRAFCAATGSVWAHWGFPLNTGGGGIPGPRRWLLKPDLKEFGKCARGHICGSEQRNERW